MRYFICSSSYLTGVSNSLLKDVESFIKEGWVPQGGVCAVSKYDGIVEYMQAMVKHEPEIGNTDGKLS